MRGLIRVRVVVVWFILVILVPTKILLKSSPDRLMRMIEVKLYPSGSILLESRLTKV
jgi:hypothetical protein